MSYQVTDNATGRTVLGNVLFETFSPVQSAVMWCVRGVAGVFGTYFDLVHANVENDSLKKEVAELKIRISATARQGEENARLRRMLGLEQKVPYRMVAGEVIGRDARAISSTLTVNRGRSSGVHMDMPAVTPEGVVGKTIQIAPLTSRVQLITDSSCSIGVMLERTVIAGILAGTGRDTCILRYLPLISDVRTGDVVVTSGQDGVFPQGLPVGKVTGLIPESDLFKSAEVAPYQEFSSVREIVFLLQTTTAAPPSMEK